MNVKDIQGKLPSLPAGLSDISGKLAGLPISPQAGAKALAIGRVGIGAALLLRPRKAGRPWVGRKASRQRGTQALLRSMGARDVVIGMIALHTLNNPQVGPRWQRTCAGIDAVDALVTLLAIGDLPLYGVVWVTALAGGSAAAGFTFADGLAAAAATAAAAAAVNGDSAAAE
ncbi:MAG TPA: hypothetical protein VHW26_02660 [Solirubrobacteraceae bacterium]|nr:hypothetical protein [Solirubrobacteraceae bacterium]